jgi:O-methyltransferase
MTPKELIKQHPVISEQIEKVELTIVLEELEQVLGSKVAGDVCEFGCFIGTTSLFLQRLLLNSKQKKKLYLYDSFQGLPAKSLRDESAKGVDFIEGELMATKSQLKLNFKKANLPLPKVKKAWFSDLKPKDVPKNICFAFLDGDFYESIKSPLSLIKDNLEPGSVIIIDDYDNLALPGAKLATDQFISSNIEFKIKKITHSLAIIMKS